MAPRSPTQAFDPTPALAHHPDNFSALASSHRLDMATNGERGVRFAELPPARRQGRHSIATTDVPLLAGVPSASPMPRHGVRLANAVPEVDVTAYMEQCRLVNVQLREAHEHERKSWNIERTALQARIGELEMLVRKKSYPQRSASNESSVRNPAPVKVDHPLSRFGLDGAYRSRVGSEPAIAVQPVWKGPGSPAPATRVFSQDSETLHLPSISEIDAIPLLAPDLSPTAKPENVPVAVEDVDKTLDGITLRSAGLTSSFDAKVTSPDGPSPKSSPPLGAATAAPPAGLQIPVDSLLPPSDEKLTLHAGHTPMAFDGTMSPDTASTDPLTPIQEAVREPAPTRRPPLRPSENSDSYFSFTSAAEVVEDRATEPTAPREQPLLQPVDDPALKGPLTLDSAPESKAASAFLQSVNEKLEEAVSRSAADAAARLDGVGDETPGSPGKTPPNNVDLPELKIRKSTNFGSAWGGDMPGRI